MRRRTDATSSPRWSEVVCQLRNAPIRSIATISPYGNSIRRNRIHRSASRFILAGTGAGPDCELVSSPLWGTDGNPTCRLVPLAGRKAPSPQRSDRHRQNPRRLPADPNAADSATMQRRGDLDLSLRFAPQGVECGYGTHSVHASGRDECINAGSILPTLAVRSGDSTATERRRLWRHPPDVLLTTPESVAVLLSQPRAPQLFAGLRWVVVDEVHALAASKRGADLALSLERLTQLAQRRLQRIGLSATATPLTEAARWLAGDGCAIARAAEAMPLQLTLVPLEESGHFLANLVDRLMPEVRGNRSTLVFTNNRRLAEQLGWALRRNMPEMQAEIAVHHSSLSAERRRQVEEKFKQGQLRAVISSTSLELGIDIGAIDLVVLVHPPGDVIRLLQRIGRAGHAPGRVGRGLVLTATEAELLEAVVTAASGQAGQCEPLRIPTHPLDVLCQHILGMAAAQTCSADTMFDLFRRAAPYRDLSRQDFDDCLAYLGCRPVGQVGEPDLRLDLPARLRGEPASFTILNQRVARLLRRNLGTILADPVHEVWLSAGGPRTEDSRIGEVDRAFAERLRVGDRFLLDGRCLQVRSILPEESCVRVEEVAGRPVVPRWGGSGWPLSTELAQRLYLLRVQAAEGLRAGHETLARLLRREYGLDDAA